MTMQTRNPDFAQRVRESFALQGAMRTLGASVEAIAPGRVVIVMAHRPELTQQHGFVHAGMVATGLDSACGFAAFTLMPADAGVLTIEFKINLLAPARGPLLRFEGAVTKAGRTISVVDGKAYQFEPGAEHDSDAHKLIATMTATVMTVVGRDDVRH
ncbi:MAG: PaaI family thioesterase [Pseudomonadota bacterium]